MEEKINGGMFLMGVTAIVLTLIMTVSIYHNAFKTQQKEDVRLYGQMLENVCEHLDSYEALDDFKDENVRMTVVASEGTVLYDSEALAADMESHKDRPEIKEAVETGEGEDTRQSDTMGYDTYYYARLLRNGDVFRVAMDVETMFQGYNTALPGVVLVGCVIMLLSIIFSVMLTKRIVTPIEKMAENLEDIDKQVPYKELRPFAYAVKEYQLEKEQNANMRQEFTANVSHELKTPLTSISGYAEMIETGMAKENDIKVFAGKIRTEASRLLVLIGDILKLSELDETTKDLVVQKENIDLLPLAKGVIERLEFKAEEAQVEITFKGEPTMVLGNRRMLEEMVYNLCDNAIKYNIKGGFVHVEIHKKDGHAEISVADNGIGIPKEYQERIFERFYRVDKSRSKATGGTGLGLAIVKHVAINHNAKVRIKSEYGEGTEIRIIFNK